MNMTRRGKERRREKSPMCRYECTAAATWSCTRLPEDTEADAVSGYAVESLVLSSIRSNYVVIHLFIHLFRFDSSLMYPHYATKIFLVLANIIIVFITPSFLSILGHHSCLPIRHVLSRGRESISKNDAWPLGMGNGDRGAALFCRS